MTSIKATIIASFVIALFYAPAASAQATASAISIVSGNGQMPCPNCARKLYTQFYPLVVKVTDASGQPIANKTVTWQISSGPFATVTPTSVTNSKGDAFATFFPSFTAGSVTTPFIQNTVLAVADNVSATFTLTTAQFDSLNSVQLVFSRLDSPGFSDTLSGPAGSISPVPVRIHIDGFSIPVPNVSVRLQNADPKTQPSATCVTQAGADPGSVLTDVNGDAVCNVLFGSVPGQGTFNVLVGGLDPIQFDQTESPQPLPTALAYSEYDGIHINVTQVTASQVSVSSGNNQSLNPGQTSSPLVVKVTDSSGSVPVSGATVTFSVSPTAGASLGATTVTTNASGLAQTTLTLSAAATSQFTVKAALGSTGSVATFTVNTNIQITALTKVSGDQQSSPANQPFGAPLVVQVTGSNLQPLANVGVSFSVSGPATLSSNSATTDGNGRAQVSVTAGAGAGTVSVVAGVANISQTFTLTVIPPGPALSSASFVNAGGKGAGLSPCSLATVVATGLAPGIQGLVLQSNAFGPWNTSLAGDTVTVSNVAAPISSVGTVSGQEQLTFQVPCEAAPGTVPVTILVNGGSGTANITLTAASPGIFETVMSDKVSRAVVVRPDGSFVTLANPARRGEIDRVFVNGMGPTTPSVPTGALPLPGSDALVSGAVIVGINNAGTRVVTARLSPNLIGVYEVAFQVPTDAPTGNDVVLSVAVNAPGDNQTRFSNGSRLPIQ